jgi:hypothetical protein
MTSLKELKRTGSVSQDALRLGFQTTCKSGIETLLKIDDITIEACEEFKDRHMEKINDTSLNDLAKRIISRHDENHRSTARTKFWCRSSSFPTILWQLLNKNRYNHKIKKQKLRKFEIVSSVISKTKLDVKTGRWKTNVKFVIRKHAWSGILNGNIDEIEHLKEELVEIDDTIETRAKVCNVRYINYDDFNETYIPDEATLACYEAKEIGMTNLLVAKPVVENSKPKDPIIVGHVGEQMFIIAWFGYDKTNHMSCNI